MQQSYLQMLAFIEAKPSTTTDKLHAPSSVDSGCVEGRIHSAVVWCRSTPFLAQQRPYPYLDNFSNGKFGYRPYSYKWRVFKRFRLPAVGLFNMSTASVQSFDLGWDILAGFTAPLVNYTAWWQKHEGVNNLPLQIVCSMLQCLTSSRTATCWLRVQRPSVAPPRDPCYPVSNTVIRPTQWTIKNVTFYFWL